MVIERYADLLVFTKPEYGVPADFFEQGSPDDTSCIYLVSCLANDRILYMQSSCESLTGYPPAEFIKKGMDFWFPLIHPEDLHIVTERFVQLHQELFKPGFVKEQLEPLVLEYRFKRPDGEWWKVRDTKYFLFQGNEIAIDQILCKLELIRQPDKMSVGEVMRKGKSCTKMLEFALVHNNQSTKQPLHEGQDKTIINGSFARPELTKREKEILQLIGEGLSTKMIADKCKISVNTVETHRRHLLEKLQVKNSMELIKEASKIFWL